jgi:hypothetical protein
VQDFETTASGAEIFVEKNESAAVNDVLDEKTEEGVINQQNQSNENKMPQENVDYMDSDKITDEERSAIVS